MSLISESKPRIQPIDLLRGAVMIIMALDHCRDFFHAHSIAGNDPLDFKTTNTSLFLTRWVTHFCAPIFVFLAGTSIYFVEQRRTLKAVSQFLVTRGLWLILLEITIINWGWVGNMSYHFLGLFVIWALGFSMLFMALFVHLPKKLLLIIGLLLVGAHNFLDSYDAQVGEDVGGYVWSILHVPHFFPLDKTHALFVGYPLIPWIGLMVLGYLLGNLYSKDFVAKKRQNLLMGMGISCIVVFIILRSGNFYGDYFHWETQQNFAFTVLSFINTTKYPPSLLYALMTIGPGLIFLALAEKWKGKWVDIISVFGRVPFFYYILHVYLIHAVALMVFFSLGYQWTDLDPNAVFGGLPKGSGVSLWMTYILWALVVVVLYFPCRWYNRYKSTHKQWWLSYL